MENWEKEYTHEGVNRCFKCDGKLKSILIPHDIDGEIVKWWTPICSLCKKMFINRYDYNYMVGKAEQQKQGKETERK